MIPSKIKATVLCLFWNELQTGCRNALLSVGMHYWMHLCIQQCRNTFSNAGMHSTMQEYIQQCRNAFNNAGIHSAMQECIQQCRNAFNNAGMHSTMQECIQQCRNAFNRENAFTRHDFNLNWIFLDVKFAFLCELSVTRSANNLSRWYPSHLHYSWILGAPDKMILQQSVPLTTKFKESRQHLNWLPSRGMEEFQTWTSLSDPDDQADLTDGFDFVV